MRPKMRTTGPSRHPSYRDLAIAVSPSSCSQLKGRVTQHDTHQGMKESLRCATIWVRIDCVLSLYIKSGSPQSAFARSHKPQSVVWGVIAVSSELERLCLSFLESNSMLSHSSLKKQKAKGHVFSLAQMAKATFQVSFSNFLTPLQPSWPND